MYAFCNVKLLLANGLERFAQDEGNNTEEMTARYVFLPQLPSQYQLTAIRERREHSIFEALLKICPGFQERLFNASPEEVLIIADLVSRFQPYYLGVTY